MENQLLVRKIENGTIIDHIPAWKADTVLQFLDLKKEIQSYQDVSLISLNNVPSNKYTRKDVIKLNHFLLEKDYADLACFVFPTITIHYIDNWYPRKYIPKIPEKILRRIRCPQASCITNASREPIITRFSILHEFKRLQCDYCDSLLDFSEMLKYTKTS